MSRVTLQQGETTPYLDMLHSLVKRLRVAIVADTGHFPQIDEAEQVNQLIMELCVGDLMNGLGKAPPDCEHPEEL